MVRPVRVDKGALIFGLIYLLFCELGDFSEGMVTHQASTFSENDLYSFYISLE